MIVYKEKLVGLSIHYLKVEELPVPAKLLKINNIRIIRDHIFNHKINIFLN